MNHGTADGLHHVVIQGGTGPGAVTTKIFLDGQELRGCRRLELRMEAGHELPVVVVEVYAGQLDVELPDVVLAALDATRDVADEGHGVHVLERAGAGFAGGDANQNRDTLVRLASRVDGEGVDLDTLPDRYIALPIRNRLAILHRLHAISGRTAELALEDEPAMAIADQMAFETVARLGKLREFSALVDAHAAEVAEQRTEAAAS